MTGYSMFLITRHNRMSHLTQVVVIIVIWIISLLVIYMLFLVCLDPLLNKKTQLPYQEQNNEEVLNQIFCILQFLIPYWLFRMKVYTDSH